MEEVYTIPLREAFRVSKTKRASSATKTIKEYLTGKLKLSNVRVDPSINEALWVKGVKKPPRRIRIKIIKEEDKVIASLVE
ncbi:MAG: 60S ribosomal protein L31 [Candidatus Altiarchaeota archaeon]|nr:60S ribosomal protein L31 [Candidatus Altiarchaeota archaeon]